MDEDSQPTGSSSNRRRSCDDDNQQPTFGIRRGDAPREDSFLIPSSDWRWGEGTDFVLMTDFALAASNAVNQIFLPLALTVITCMCSIHAWNLWADNHHRSDFRDYKKNRNKMGRDFERYKRVPHTFLVAPACVLMMLHWKNSYKEKNVAELWETQWAKTRHTMVEVNESSHLFRGGIPAHNNHIEGSNREDKAILNWEKHKLVPFFYKITEDLHDRSKADLSYHTWLVQKVHNRSVLRLVYEQLALGDGDDAIASPFNVSFSFSSKALGYDTDTILIPSISLISGQEKDNSPSLWCQFVGSEYKKKMTVAYVKQSIVNAALHTSFKKVLKDAEKNLRCVSTHGRCMHGFDILMRLMDCFRVIQPIVGETKADDEAIGTFLNLLKISGFEVADTAKVVELCDERRGLVSCTCGDYFMYQWCHHAIAFAVKRKIITGWPKNMHPKNTTEMKQADENTKHAGRPRKCVPGEALNKNG